MCDQELPGECFWGSVGTVQLAMGVLKRGTLEQHMARSGGLLVRSCSCTPRKGHLSLYLWKSWLRIHEGSKARTLNFRLEV